MQNKIFFASRNFNLKLIRISQKILISSLITRLLVVRDILETEKTVFGFKNFISSEEKFQLALNLKYNRFISTFTSIFFNKNPGLSFFFNLSTLFSKGLQSLWVVTCLPLVETTLDRSFYLFRPYRNYLDLLLNLKKTFYLNKNFFWYLSVKFSCPWNVLNRFWLLKNFPVEKRILKSWFDTLFTTKYLEHSLKSNKLDILKILLNYMLTGLEALFISKLKFLNSNNFKVIQLFNNIFVFCDFPDKFDLYKFIVIDFLKLRGINVIDRFILIDSFFKGFNILGLSFYRSFLIFSPLIQIDTNIIKEYKLKLKTIIKSSKNSNFITILKNINKEITLCATFYRLKENYNFFLEELDLYVHKIMWKFVKKLHPRRSSLWVYYKYWKRFSGIWRFTVYDSDYNKLYFLKLHKSFNTSLYCLPVSFNTFDLYNSKKTSLSLYKKYISNYKGINLFLYHKQKGICFRCKQTLGFKNFKLVNISTFINKKINSVSNLYLLHLFCN